LLVLAPSSRGGRGQRWRYYARRRGSRRGAARTYPKTTELTAERDAPVARFHGRGHDGAVGPEARPPASLIAWSDALFVRVGRGTPASYDPPVVLVIRGPFRWVRNPMYVGAGLVVGGVAVWTQAVALAGYALLIILGCHLFLVFIEEPQLRARFGAPYGEYCRLVPRWLPRW
jgi:hypothetical protein